VPVTNNCVSWPRHCDAARPADGQLQLHFVIYKLLLVINAGNAEPFANDAHPR
jgi:hypothetical protein